MQPEPNEIPTQDQAASFSSTTVNSNHGFNHAEQHLALQLSPTEGSNQSPRSVSSNACSETSSEASSEGSDSSSWGLSASRPSARSPVDRISEHEKALINITKRKKRGRVAFTVVQRSRNPDSPGTALVDFPNEVLTHILSHLPPASLADVSLVSRRFHELVTTPHAWRIAFARFFPGAESLRTLESESELSEDRDEIRAERRLFTRLTALASWRSEYILRTRLLRSLGRGKPAEIAQRSGSGSSRSASGISGNAQITYSSSLTSTANHLHATFGSGLNKKLPRFIHGSADLGTATTSDPRNGKVDSWGSSDFTMFRQFAESFPSDAQYGMGDGELVGVPNVMDVSQTYGMVYGEGLPAGVLYFRHLEEKRGRNLAWTVGTHVPQRGVPNVREGDAVCSVWISKSSNIADLSDGLIGLLSGSSTGVLTAYSVGTNGMQERRFERGEITARWVLSPGVPIIAIAVDENLSSKRLAARRVWAVVLNALGETYYLTDLPKQPDIERSWAPGRTSRNVLQQLEVTAWLTGRTVNWKLVEPTRRIAKADPFDRLDADGSYSPRTSWDGMHLSKEQLAAETKEVEVFLGKKPKDFQSICHGWDMRRRLEVDFAACDQSGAGEGIVVIGCGLEEGQISEIRRYTRCIIPDMLAEVSRSDGEFDQVPTGQGSNKDSLFGQISSPGQMQSTWSFGPNSPAESSSINSSSKTIFHEEWRSSVFLLAGLKNPQITTSAVDVSTYATLTTNEDSLLSENESLITSSPNDVPGQRARILAVGTNSGTINLWNMRAPTASNTIVANSVKPVRLIYTDSPQISCLALTALYLVHGGNDGLVQAWDLLASSTDPIRTLNSRFSSRARRRLIQAEASPAGVGINLFAAGALFLDPDPTVLRGMVSLGSHLRYWSYSALAADQYKGSKRRLRRSERGSNQSRDRFSGTGRGALKEYITNEKMELERDKRNKRKEEERLAGRFGVDLLGPGASEDEILAYATMLSEESAQNDELRRKSTSDESSNGTIIEEVVHPPSPSVHQNTQDDDGDMAEAIRLSLQDNSPRAIFPSGALTGSPSFPVRYTKKKGTQSASWPRATARASQSKTTNSSTSTAEVDDVEYALQLSLAEQDSQQEHTSYGQDGKGKGRES